MYNAFVYQQSSEIVTLKGAHFHKQVSVFLWIYKTLKNVDKSAYLQPLPLVGFSFRDRTGLRNCRHREKVLTSHRKRYTPKCFISTRVKLQIDNVSAKVWKYQRRMNWNLCYNDQFLVKNHLN